ncbi:MAG TPA: penicillin-binding transpeptidase domain-containing protein, partial [Clostridia bacterium]
KAMELLAARVQTTTSDAGAMVVIDVRNGDILAMASYPTYDPRDFLLMETDKAAAARVESYLTDNVNKPMLNRTIMENYAPGSCFKPCMSTAGLESGVITPYTLIQCTGYVEVDGLRFKCLGVHGWLDLSNALRVSCNSYFYKLGMLLGIDRIDEWAKRYGLGEYTGIDLVGEIPGMRSNPKNKALTRLDPGDQIWNPADTVQSSIGQFDNAYTVLQLARYAAALATGNLVTPHVIKEVTAYDGTVVFTGGGTASPTGASAATLAAIRKGMVSVTDNPGGGGYRFFKDFPVKVAMKTGTAEFGTSSINTNGLVISYAPADNPQIAIAHMISKNSAGSIIIDMHYEMYKAYFLAKAEAAARLDPVQTVH